MNESTKSKIDPSSDFLKSWSESFSRILQSACTFTPETMPPEMLRQIRSGIFEALAKSWEEFMRSPQFLESMKAMMDNAVAFRQMSSEFFSKVRRETEGTTREDADGLLQAVHEMEARLMRQVEALASQVRQMQAQAGPDKATRTHAEPKSAARRKTSHGKPAATRKSARARK